MQAVLERDKRGYERFIDNRRFEEKTDIAERLSFPIDVTIAYEMRGGAAYALTDTKDRPFHDQTREALEKGRFAHTGDEAFQVTRLELEDAEALMIDAFGRGELSGNVLVKFSKVPDAVVRGETNIDGYRRDILRSFVRIYYRRGDKVICRLFTLDGNHTAGVKAVGQLLGIDTTMQSEVVLASSKLWDVPEGELDDFTDGMAMSVKQRYEEEIFADTGRVTHAGSEFIDATDAMQAINNQPVLFEQHWHAITDIMARGLDATDEKELLKTERKRTAAAIMLSTRGEMVLTNNDAGVLAEVESGNYDLDCPTANTMGMNQAAHQESQTIACKQCPICGRANVIATIEGDLISGTCGCEKEICSGKIRRMGRGPAERQTSEASIMTDLAPKLSKDAMIKARYGQRAKIRKEIAIGGQDIFVVDGSTGDVIAKL